jgi:DNA-binding NarL/FixJ family response regulator
MAESRQGISVLIADSTPMGTELLAGAVERDSKFHIIRSIAGDGELMQVAAQERPVVAVISAGLSGDASKGCEIARELQLASRATKTILLMDHPHRELVVEAFRAGARGVFCRAGSIEELCKCIDRVSRGQIWAGCNEIKYVLDALVQATPLKLAPLGMTLLSRREKEVVRYVAEGLSNREIAGRLKLSEHTIKNYLFRIFDKLGVSSRAELVFLAFSSPAELVNPDAQNASSVQIPEEDVAAFVWCSKAADRFTTAQFLLGQMYRDGRGTEKDPVAAYMWFQIAEATTRRRLQASVKSAEQLASELDAGELAEAKRRAAEWLKLNSSELAGRQAAGKQEVIPTTSRLASNPPAARRKRIPAA